MSDINIGKKIAQIRTNKNLSVRKLAELSNVTASMLSQIERGNANPSVNSLKSIASALEVPLFTFFTSEVAKEDLIVRKDNRKKVILPESDNVIYEILAPGSSDNFEFAIMILEPNTSSSNGDISHTGYELAYVLEGEATVYLDNEEFTMGKGDSIKISAGINHRWENNTNEYVKVIFAVIL